MTRIRAFSLVLVLLTWFHKPLTAQTGLARWLDAEVARIPAPTAVYVKHLGTGEEAGVRAAEHFNTSDNTATDLMVQKIGGVAELNRWLAESGYGEMKMVGRGFEYRRRLLTLLDPALADLTPEETTVLMYVSSGNPLFERFAPLFAGEPARWIDLVRDPASRRRLAAERLKRTSEDPEFYARSGPIVMAVFTRGNTTPYGEMEDRIGELARDVVAHFDGGSSASRQAVTSPERELEQLERRLVAAIAAMDLVTYDQLVADDYVVLSAAGTERTKADVIVGYKAGTQGYRGLEISEVKAHVFGDTAIVSARTLGFRVEGGKETPNRVRYVRVFARRNGRWQAVAQMATPLPPDQQ